MNGRARLPVVALATLSLALLVAEAPSKAKKPPSPPGSSTSVAAPVFSTDACSKDQDCVAAVPCHANACASVTHADKAANEAICTMDCRGGTVDCGYNHCGCVKGPSGTKVCALLPGPGAKR